jgi:ribulose-bisphosphate carboxylase large chain
VVKPLGLPPERLAEVAHELALGGLDIVKDDHGLADQPFAAYRERVARCADAVRRAAAVTGHPTRYVPAVHGDPDRFSGSFDFLRTAGVGGVLVPPGLMGFDYVRHVASELRLPIMSHPAMLGSFVAGATYGIAPDVLFGTIMRLAGVDMSVFPVFGGRLPFDAAACRAIAAACVSPMGDLESAVPTPGGGMRLDRIEELVGFFGRDLMLLVGGALYRGRSLAATAEAFRKTVDRCARPETTPTATPPSGTDTSHPV